VPDALLRIYCCGVSFVPPLARDADPRGGAPIGGGRGGMACQHGDLYCFNIVVMIFHDLTPPPPFSFSVSLAGVLISASIYQPYPQLPLHSNIF